MLSYGNSIRRRLFSATYIPSEQVLKEGGYEGDTAQILYGLPGKWREGIESHILSVVKELHHQTGP